MSFKVAVFGEALFDFIQHEEGRFEAELGGSPMNTARGFVNQNVECHYLSPISRDHMGQKIYEDALREGICLPENNRSDKPTSLALVFQNERAQPEYSLYRKSVADLDISTDKLLQVLPENLDLFHTGSLALVPQVTQVLVPVIKTLKGRGVKISVDINFRNQSCVPHNEYLSAIWQVVELADIVKVSDEDLYLMGFLDTPEVHARQILERMDKGIVVLTLGEDGSQLISAEHNIFQHVCVPEKFVDTIGAGDTFFSALIAQLLREDVLTWNGERAFMAYALKFASFAAALNIEKQGCHPPNLNQVQSRMCEMPMMTG